jgi:hypothetical protein
VRQQLTPGQPSPFNYAWHSPDQGSVSDILLTSPVVHVGAGGTTFSFNHRYSFESTFDGGVVETSTDGGGSWQDIGAANLSPSYAAAPLVAGSPLAGRRAYTGNSGGLSGPGRGHGDPGTGFRGTGRHGSFPRRLGRRRRRARAGTSMTSRSPTSPTRRSRRWSPRLRIRQSTASQPAHAWIGLKNGNDAGLNLDILAEVFRNGVLIGSGTLTNVSAGSTGWNGSIDRAITLAMSSPGHAGACTGDTLSIKVSVRAGSTGKSSGTARLWYNDPQANSRFGATIAGTANTYYLLNGFVLGTSPGPVGQRLNIDVTVNRSGGNPWKAFGTWSKTF